MWLACDKNGTMALYVNKPTRGRMQYYPSDADETYLVVDKSSLTWEDEPIEVSVHKKLYSPSDADETYPMSDTPQPPLTWEDEPIEVFVHKKLTDEEIKHTAKEYADNISSEDTEWKMYYDAFLAEAKHLMKSIL